MDGEPASLKEAQEDATIVTIRAQEEIGIDVVTDGEIPDKILANAPASEDHFFLVPKVVE